MNELFQWIFMFIMAAVPPTDPGHRTRGQETIEQTTARYEEISNDIIEVVFDENNKPLFTGPNGRSHTAAVLLAIMYHESRFYRHIDEGERHGRGDGGKSWCMMQVMAGQYPGKTASWNTVYDRPPRWGDPPEQIRQGYTGQELIENRKLCIQEGLRIARWSFTNCGGPLLERLKVYASGSCSKGAAASRNRMRTAESFWARSQEQRTWADDDVVTKIRQILQEKTDSSVPENQSEPNTLRFQLSNPLEQALYWNQKPLFLLTL